MGDGNGKRAQDDERQDRGTSIGGKQFSSVIWATLSYETGTELWDLGDDTEGELRNEGKTGGNIRGWEQKAELIRKTLEVETELEKIHGTLNVVQTARERWESEKQ